MRTNYPKQFFKLLLSSIFIVLLASSCSEEAPEGEELVGTWLGVSVDPDAPDDFEIRDNFTFQLPMVDQRTGTWRFQNIASSNCDPNEWNCDFKVDCTGFLIYKTKIGNTYTFEEGALTGDCIDGGFGEFEVVNENTINYKFLYNQAVLREAILTRN